MRKQCLSILYTLAESNAIETQIMPKVKQAKSEKKTLFFDIDKDFLILFYPFMIFCLTRKRKKCYNANTSKESTTRIPCHYYYILVDCFRRQVNPRLFKERKSTTNQHSNKAVSFREEINR